MSGRAAVSSRVTASCGVGAVAEAHAAVLPGPPYYWRAISPLIHSPRGRALILALLTALFVLAPAILPDGPLTFNVVP